MRGLRGEERRARREDLTLTPFCLIPVPRLPDCLPMVDQGGYMSNQNLGMVFRMFCSQFGQLYLI